MEFHHILLLIGIGALLVFAAFLKTPMGKGFIGETVIKLRIGRQIAGERRLINNIIIMNEKGKSSQIDHILINQNGVFVIETKNYSGRIYGDQNQIEWTQVLAYGKIKNKFYNPIKQNQTHVWRVKEALGEDIPIYSCVVFVNGNTDNTSGKEIFNIKSFKEYVSLHYGAGRLLESEEIESIYNVLLEIKRSKKISTREHLQNISTLKNNLEQNICPRCGKKLILKKGKYNNFYGCIGYPICKFTKQYNTAEEK